MIAIDIPQKNRSLTLSLLTSIQPISSLFPFSPPLRSSLSAMVDLKKGNKTKKARGGEGEECEGGSRNLDVWLTVRRLDVVSCAGLGWDLIP
jgi:hypothetical protein